MIVLTCGHEIDSFDDDHYEVMIKGYTREWNKCVEYRTVCSDCYDDYKTHNLILENEELAHAWIMAKGLE